MEQSMKNAKFALLFSVIMVAMASQAQTIDVGSGIGIDHPTQAIRSRLQESFQERDNSEKSYKENEAAVREPVTLRKGENRIGVELENGFGTSGSRGSRLKDWAQPETGYKERHLQKKLDRELNDVKHAVQSSDDKLVPVKKQSVDQARI
jgi:hypothetical protein